MYSKDEIDSAIEKVKTGEVEAFRIVIEAFHVPIRAFIHAQLTNATDADELAQETFLFAFRHLHEYQTGSNFSAWLKAIARNKVMAHLKKIQQDRKNSETLKEQMIILRSIELAGEHLEERIDALKQCIEMLPPLKVEFLKKVSTRQGTLEMLASELGRSSVSVRKEISRLYTHLRDCIKRRLKQEQRNSAS